MATIIFPCSAALQDCSQLSLGLEGLYYDFGSDSSHLVTGDQPFVLNEDQNFATVRARLNYPLQQRLLILPRDPQRRAGV